MKKLSFLASLLLAFALCWSAPARAKDSAAQTANRAAIIAAYERGDRALMKKDVATVVSMVAPDFHYYGTNGTVMDRAKWVQVESFLMRLPNVKFPRSETKITKWQWRGPDAVVWTSSVLQTTGPGGTSLARVQMRDYWGKTAQGWQVRQSVEISGVVRLNGQTYTM